MFALSHSDMVRINPTMASHKLNIVSTAKPMRQKVRHFHSDCHQIIQTEVDNLLRAGFIREVKYPEWLANVVVVLKKGGKWRVCINYTDLNEVCPKDSFPLPQYIKLSTPQLDTGYCHFWTPSLDIIKYPCTRLTQRKRPSLHLTGYTVTM